MPANRPPRPRTHEAKQLLARTVLQRLKAAYPGAHCELEFSSPLELLVATILSAQCTDVRVNQVTRILFQQFRTAHDYAQADPSTLETLIHSTGFYRNKARNIIACCRQLVDRFDGEVPRNMEDLHALPGVGRKTANVVLGNAFGLHVGIVVDTHVTRLANLLGLTRHRDAVKIESDLVRLIPQGPDWTLFSHLLIWHGRRRCRARQPDCPACELRDLCPSRRD